MIALYKYLRYALIFLFFCKICMANEEIKKGILSLEKDLPEDYVNKL
jgi:hypothetical protein